MKTLLLLLLSINSVFCDKSGIKMQEIRNLVEQYFSKFKHIDVVYCGKKSGEGETIFEKVLQVMPEALSVRVVRIEENLPSSKHLKTASIVVFDSLENFVNVVKDIKWQQTNPKTLHPHLVYLPGAGELDIQDNIEDGLEIDKVPVN